MKYQYGYECDGIDGEIEHDPVNFEDPKSVEGLAIAIARKRGEAYGVWRDLYLYLYEAGNLKANVVVEVEVDPSFKVRRR
jgi:hypothetical protein